MLNLGTKKDFGTMKGKGKYKEKRGKNRGYKDVKSVKMNV